MVAQNPQNANPLQPITNRPRKISAQFACPWCGWGASMVSRRGVFETPEIQDTLDAIEAHLRDDHWPSDPREAS
jgi:hypothetical protein